MIGLLPGLRKFVLAAVFVLLFNLPAHAVVIGSVPDAFWESTGEGMLNQGTFTNDIVISNTYGAGNTFIWPANSAFYPVFPNGVAVTPELTANATFLDAAGGSVSVSAYLEYQFTLLGPPGVTVPLQIISQGETSTTGGGGTNYCINQDVGIETAASAGFVLTTDGGTTHIPQVFNFLSTSNTEVQSAPADNICTFTTGTTSTFPAGFLDVSVTSGALETVQLTASASASINVAPGVGDAVSSALVDPYIQIDPAFALANEFSLEFSPFIANELTLAIEVPEPSTLLLVSGAFIALATVTSRRRSRRAER